MSAGQAPSPSTSSRQRFAEYRHARRRTPPDADAVGGAGRPPDEDEARRRRKRARSFFALFMRFWRMIRPHRGPVLAGLATLAISSGLVLLMPAATKIAFDYIITDHPGPLGLPDWLPAALRSPDHRLRILVALGGAMMAITAVRICIGLWGRWQFTRLTKRVQAMLRRRVFDHAVRLPLHRVQQIKSGGVASMLREDAGGAGELLFTMLYNPWSALIQLVGTLVILAAVDWRMLTGGLILLPAVWLTHQTWIARIRPLYRDIRTTRTSIDAHAAEAFGGMRVVRGFARERGEAGRFTRGTHFMARQEILTWWWSRGIDIAWSLFIPLASTAVLLYGGYAVIRQELTIGDVMMFLAYLMMLLGPLEALASSATNMQDNLAGFDRILDLLAEPREFEEPPAPIQTPVQTEVQPAARPTGLEPAAGAMNGALGTTTLRVVSSSSPSTHTPVVAVDPRMVRGRITLRDVWFAYPARPGAKREAGRRGSQEPDAERRSTPDKAPAPVIRGVSLDVQPGETIALVGPSGSGKTTLCNLIARFFDPQQGSIELDGVDLRHINVASYRRLLGIVEQDVFLFDGTVAENIGYARRGAPLPLLAEAARAANADAFIRKLDKGYDTLIGERGVRLSGGQKQRIAIARALLADPKILILDEATSNLDTESERLIQRSLRRLMQSRTSFVIAHRLSTIRHASRIAVLEEGRIIELGTHDELLAAGGRYAKFLRMQVDESAEDAEDTESSLLSGGGG